MGRDWSKRFASVVERAGRRIPDPVIIFMAFYPIAFVASVLLGGHRFETAGAGGDPVVHTIRGMHEAEHVRWIFDNALLANWLAFGGGVLGVILVVMLAIGVAEHSGLFAAVIKRLGRQIPVAWMPLLLMLLGITSSVATDAGYLVLIPLAGLLYAGLGRNPLIGMAAAFAGVSAGFSANLIPGTPVDVIIGMNAQVFAESQGIPFENAAGQPLRPATMHYFFIATSTVVLALTGAWVTRRWVEPKLSDQPFEIPDDLDVGSFEMTDRERRGLGAEGLLALGLQRFPVLLLIGFVLTTALINLLIGGLTSKWMLLGPIFVPMLYFVNPAMTPDVVAAAFRVADSATNIITPMMAYAGVILAFMRKYRPELGFGDMLLIMLPYSIAFLLVWTTLLVTFFSFAIPLGF